MSEHGEKWPSRRESTFERDGFPGFVCPFCRSKVRYEHVLYNDNPKEQKPDGARAAYTLGAVSSAGTQAGRMSQDADSTALDGKAALEDGPDSTDQDLLKRINPVLQQKASDFDAAGAVGTRPMPGQAINQTFAPAEESNPLRNWTLGKKAPNKARAEYFARKQYSGFDSLPQQDRTAFSWKAAGRPEPENGVAVAHDWLIEGKLPGSVYVGDAERNFITVYADMLCPYCGCEIPPGYCEADSDHIKTVALGGGPGAGKTQFLYAIYCETGAQRRQVLAKDGVSKIIDGVPAVDTLGHFVDIVWASESKRFLDFWGRGFSEETGLANKTDVKPAFPAMMTVAPQNDRRIKYFIIMYDIAGETFQGSGRAGNIYEMGYFESVRDFLLVIDPAQLFPDLRQKMGRQYSATIAETLQKFSDHPFITKLDHIAVTLTKSDMLMQLERKNGDLQGEPYINRRMCAFQPSLAPSHGEGFNMAFCDKNSRQIECMMEQGQRSWQDALGDITARKLRSAILTGIRQRKPVQNSEVIRFFAVSTKARVEKEGKVEFTYEVDSASVRIRLLEPLMFLMHVWGIIPAIQGERG